MKSKFSLDIFKDGLKEVLRVAGDHSSQILIGIGIAGMIGSAVMAVEATPKALEKIKEDHPNGYSKKDAVKSAWKFYIPAVAVGTCGMVCIIGAERINLKKNAALATAYSLTEQFAKEYKEAAKEELGEEKEKDIQKRVAENRMKKNPYDESKLILTPEKGAKFYDPYNDRYFESNVYKLNSALNQVNNQLMVELSATLSDFYYAAGLPPTKSGDILGWRFDNGGILSLSLTPVMREDPETDEKEAFIQVDFNQEPGAYF